MSKILKIIKWTVIALFIAFAAIQFVRPDYANPPVVAGNTLFAMTAVPENVQQIFARSCNDCHTDQTNYPWYSNIAPLSWGVTRHVIDGRRHLNFSQWSSYDTGKKRKKLAEVCDEMTDGQMPLDQYLWLHPSAKISPDELKTVCEWTEAERERLSTIKFE